MSAFPPILPSGEGRFAFWYPATGAVWVTAALLVQYAAPGPMRSWPVMWGFLAGGATVAFTLALVYVVVRFLGAPVSVWAVITGMCLCGLAVVAWLCLVGEYNQPTELAFLVLWLGNGLAAPLGARLATIGQASLTQHRLDDGQEL